MIALKLRKVGNSVGAVFPQEALARLRVGEGDTLFLTEAPDGYRISSYDETFAEQIKRAERIMRKRRQALRELAK